MDNLIAEDEGGQGGWQDDEQGGGQGGLELDSQEIAAHDAHGAPPQMSLAEYARSLEANRRNDRGRREEGMR